MDPETHLDAVRTVGIRDGKIVAVVDEGGGGPDSLTGATVIDARGLVVAPGFIDLHAHGQDEENYRFQAMDGVTTALELELGTGDVDGWYAERAGKALINYGVSIGHTQVRKLAMHDSGGIYPAGDAAHRPATDAELAELERRIDEGLASGALGVGFGLQYTPGATRWEILEMFRRAAKVGAPAFVHMRYIGEKEPTSATAALEEAISAAFVTGTPIHIMHVHSSGLRSTPHLLQMIAEARERGLDISTEAYPYTAGSSGIESSLFDAGWQEMLGIGYNDVEWAATGERLTKATFDKYRKKGGIVIVHMIPEDVLTEAIASPLTIISNDGRLKNGHGHPRGAGTYARVLGHYVREEGTLTLMDALRKMTVMPAQRLEARDPAMKRKGRIQVGADADITVFDPARVIDKATYENPAQYSEGIEYVLVGGTPVVMGGKLQEGLLPGQPVRAPVDGGKR
jgi:dihydroorotase